MQHVPVRWDEDRSRQRAFQTSEPIVGAVPIFRGCRTHCVGFQHEFVFVDDLQTQGKLVALVLRYCYCRTNNCWVVIFNRIAANYSSCTSG